MNGNNLAITLFLYQIVYKNHKYLRTYNLNWFLNNVNTNLKILNPKKRYSFIELVKFYIVEQIEKSGEFFGIKVKK